MNKKTWIFVGAVAATLVSSSPAGADTLTLQFETQCLDLDGATVADPCPQPWEEGAWDVRVTYHADRSRHGVLMPNLDAGVELAFLENRGYSGVTADDIESAEFSSEVVDRAFEEGLVILVRTGATTVFMLG